MMRRFWTLLGCLTIYLAGHSSAGCSDMHPWVRKVLGERTQFCYGYGEQGEFFYLQFQGIDNERRRQLGKKIGEGTLSGGYWSCTIGSSRRHVLQKYGTPLAKRLAPTGSREYDEEWEYPRVVLLFKRGRLVDVRPKGTEQPEYLWRETYIPI